MSWEELEKARTSSTKFVEFTEQTRLTTPPQELIALAQEIVEKESNPGAAALAIATAVHAHIEYTKGVTGVQTTAEHAWENKKGVCQDIAHVTLGALRAVGIPARYVSGYLQSKPDAQIGETIVGESHAWVEWFSGDWFGYDPTNMLNIGERHVLIARGRDYKDVSPLRGVYAGASASGVFVKVEITKEA
jgi:transglutaminase-like putative cysteine protease